MANCMKNASWLAFGFAALVLFVGVGTVQAKGKIVNDAEYYNP